MANDQRRPYFPFSQSAYAWNEYGRPRKSRTISAAGLVPLAAEDRVAVFGRDFGIEQSVFFELGEHVFGDDQRPHVGVVNRGVAVEVAEGGLHVRAFDDT